MRGPEPSVQLAQLKLLHSLQQQQHVSYCNVTNSLTVDISMCFFSVHVAQHRLPNTLKPIMCKSLPHLYQYCESSWIQPQGQTLRMGQGWMQAPPPA